MQNACMNVHIRNVDDLLHSKLVERAEAKGLSLSEFLRQELNLIVQRPSHESVFGRLRKLPSINSPVSAADLVREDRDNR
jgi:plasmid stability protein